jgi:hypothetical protein
MGISDEDAQRLETLWEEVELAANIEDVDGRRHAIESAAMAVDSFVAGSRTPDALYLLGYAWYFHPDRISSRAIQNKMATALLGALDIDGGYARAWMYLGYNGYDLGKYETARDYFDRIDLDQLDSTGD